MSQITGADLSTIESILKEDYMDPIIELLNSKNALIFRVEKTAEFTQGKRAYMPLHKGRNEGLGSRPEADSNSSSNLPEAGAQEYDDASYNMTFHYGRAQFTGPAIAAARNSEGAFARLVETELDGLVRDASRDMNRQMIGPKNGSMATVVTAPSGTATDGTSLGSDEIEVTTRQFVRVGQVIDIVETNATGSLGTKNGTALSINSVTPVGLYNAILKLSSSPSGVNVNDLITRKNNFNNEMFGLIDLISASNPEHILGGAKTTSRFVGGIDRSSSGNEHWKANEIDHGNAAFGDTLFQDAIDLADVEGDGDISVFLTNHAIFNEYGNSLLPDRRFNTEGSRFAKLDGGFNALYYDDVPVIKDRDCQPNTIWGISEDRLKLLQMSDWDWMDSDGAVLARVSDKDAYSATLYKYCEFAVQDPKDHVQIKNVET